MYNIIIQTKKTEFTQVINYTVIPFDKTLVTHIGYDIDPSKTFNLDIPDELQRIGHDRILSALENDQSVTFEVKSTKFITIRKTESITDS